MTVRIAIYGADEAVEGLLSFLSQQSEVEVIAVCDPIQRLAEQLASGWSAKVHDRFESMLDEQPDAVLILVRASLQSDAVLASANRGVPFFVLPPGSSTVEQALACDEIVREKSLISTVAYPSGYLDIAVEAREFLGDSSAPLAIGQMLCTGREPVEELENLLWTRGSSMLDLFRYFCGEVESVESHSESVYHLRHATGTASTFILSALPRYEERTTLELLGEGWSLTLEDSFRRLRVEELDKVTILRSLRCPWEEHLLAFLEAVTNEDASSLRCPFSEALKTMELCQRAQSSSSD